MIGTRSSDRLPAFAAAALIIALATGPVTADQITLSGEGRLSGNVRSITGEGVVELESPHAAEPLFLRAEAVKKVTFGEDDDQGEIPTSRVELNNGDVLPVEIESLDDKELAAVSPVAGRMVIPRAALRSLVLGIHPKRVIYPGRRRSLEDMKPEGTQAENWSFDGGVWTVEGAGRLVRKLEPAKQFIARFTLEWSSPPSFQFYFADPLLPQHQASDRYLFQFNPAGMEIKRESTKGRRSTSLLAINRRPDQYPGNRLKVEIRVDRGNSLLYLFLNDEPEGRFKDPSDAPPEGGGIAFASTSSNESQISISDVEISEWDHNGDRHRTEDRGDPKTDAMIEKRGDRFGGTLISIKPSAEGPLFSFKSDFQDLPIELPESEVSTVFFRQPENPPETIFHPFALRLRGQGIIRVSACSFPGGKIEATHPLLGALTLSREGVTALERLEKRGGEP